MVKRVIPPLTGERVRLRLLAEADLPMILAWRNQPHIRQWFVHSEPITWEQHCGWYTQYAQRDNDFLFVVEETQRLHKPVGQVALYNITWAEQRAEYGRLLIGAPDALGQGLAKEATRLLLTWACGQLGLQQITLDVFTTNHRALALYHACGFRAVSEHEGMQTMVWVAR